MNYLGLFPGQGSQKVGMGKALWEESPLAKDLFAKADGVLGFSLSDLCFAGSPEELNRTENAQPAILTVAVICYELFRQHQAAKIGAVAGHSLGEFSALVAAKAIAFEDAVQLVHQRGKYMQAAVPLGAGKMIAVLGKEPAELKEACAAVVSSGAGVVELANLNAPGQIVVAGEKAAVDALAARLAGTRVVELPVTVPSHTSLMKPAAERLAEDLKNIKISPCEMPVYANFSAEPVSDPAVIRENLTAQLSNPVRWTDSMLRAVSDLSPVTSVEFGFGNVLSGLLKRIKADVPRLNIDSLATAEKALG